MMNKLLRSRFVAEYGSVFILLLLCAYYSFATLDRQHPVSPAAGRSLAHRIVREQGAGAAVLIVIRATDQDRHFAAAIQAELEAGGAQVIDTLAGGPADVRRVLEQAGAAGTRLDAIATHHPASQWGPLQADNLVTFGRQFPTLSQVQIYTPRSYLWPSFLTRENLINVVNQNADIAIIAIGMTMVIITAGIDLSVGSLLALSGVMTAVVIQRMAGGAQAPAVLLVACGLVGVGTCAVCGAFNGVMVTVFRVPAFVVTLGMMMVARGLALIIAVAYQSALMGGTAEGTPEAVKIEATSFSRLGNGEVWGVPNPILLMIVLYILGHVLMSRTSVGRYIYAVGGNPEAARLSGVPVFGVLILVYAICGAMAGLAGVLDASRFEGGRPNAGGLYELRVIAAVVVGGTSLAGGEGRIFGTLIGALIIAVIQNGLNMAGVKSYEQMVVFGLLILAAVLLDQLKKRKWRGA
jgi:ribose transport system permease protein